MRFKFLATRYIIIGSLHGNMVIYNLCKTKLQYTKTEIQERKKTLNFFIQGIFFYYMRFKKPVSELEK